MFLEPTLTDRGEKPQVMCKTACENCSCKGWKGKKEYFQGKRGMFNLEDLFSSWVDWKRTGRIFQCYMRNNGQGCMLHFEQIKWCEKNLNRVKRMLGIK